MNLIKIKSLLSKTVREIEPELLNAIMTESVNLARHYAELSVEEFETQINARGNGYIGLAWFCEYIALVNSGMNGSEEWLKAQAKNYESAREIFISWRKNKSKSLIGNIEGLFE